MIAAAVVIGIFLAGLAFSLAGSWALYTLYEHTLHLIQRKACR